MLRTCLLATALWSIALSAAEAQFISLALNVELDAYIDMTYRGDTRADCEGSFPRTTELRLEPEIGWGATQTRLYYCGDIEINLHSTLTVAEVRSEPHAIMPSVANLQTVIEVVYGRGTGTRVTVYDRTARLTLKEGPNGTLPYEDILNSPGVVIWSASDFIRGRLSP